MPTLPPNNNTGLYGSSASSPSIPPNNTTGLYGIDNGAVVVNNDVVADQIAANTITANTISTTGNITAGGYFIGNVIGNITGNITAPGSNGEVLFNDGGTVGADSGFTYDKNTNSAVLTGNITAAYITGNGSQLTSLAGANVTGTVANAAYSNLATYVTANAQGNITSVGTLTTLTVSGTTNLGNIFVSGSRTIDVGNNRIGNLQDPIAFNDAATKDYVDSQISGSDIFAISDGITTEGVAKNDTIYFEGVVGETTVTVSSPSNVTIGLPDDVTIFGNLTANSGNIITDLTVGGTIYGTFAGNISGNLVVPGSNTDIIYNNAGNAGASNDFTYNNATKLVTLNGTANVANLNATNEISAQGNITGNYIFGNGSQLTGLPATYGNANVTDFLGNGFGSNTITTTGNITAGYFIGNGSQLTGLPAQYGNANVAAYLPTYTGNISAYDITVANTAQATYVVANSFGNVGNVDVYSTSGLLWIQAATGNLRLTAGSGQTIQADNPISVSGNVTGTNLLTAGAVSATGNVTGNYFIGDGSLLTNINAGNIVGAYGNANVANFLANFGSNTITTTGNITAGYFIGNGSHLTDITAANVTGTVANATYALNANSATFAGTVTTNAQPNITSVGNLTSLVVSGNISGGNLSTSGNITGNYIIGNGSALTDITAANVTGTVANATYALSANSATFAGTVTTNAQPNITSVGNLTSLTVSGDSLMLGNLQVNGNVTYIASNTVTINDKFINVANNAANSSQATGGGIGVGPAGSEYATWTFSDANTAWQSNIKIEAPAVSATGNITGNYIIGDGSLLTNINAGNIIGSYGNANVADFLANGFGSNTITTSGNITAGKLSATGNVSAGGALTTPKWTIQGNTITSPNGGTWYSDEVNLDEIISSGNDGYIDLAARYANGDRSSEIHLEHGLAHISTDPSGNSQYWTFYGNGLMTAPGAISTTGNITAGYFIGNGALLTGIASTYGNANVANYLPTFGGNVGAGNVVLTTNTGRVYVNEIQGLSGAGLSITADGTEDINLNADTIRVGDNNADATIATHGAGDLILRTHLGDANQGNIIIRDGAGGNIDITPNGSGRINLNGSSGVVVQDGISATGNITGGNINTVGIVSATGNILSIAGLYGPLVSVSGNVIGGNAYIAGLVSATGNVTGNYFIGNGSLLTGIATSYGNANVANFLANGFGSNNITTTGNIQAGNLAVTNVVSNPSGANVTFQDNLVVLGNASLSNSSYLDIGSVRLQNDNVSPASLNIIADSVDIIGTGLSANAILAATISLSGNVLSPITTANNITTSANVSANNLSITNLIANPSGANITLQDNLIVDGNISMSNSSVLRIGSVSIENDNVAPASINITADSVDFSNGITAVALSASGNVTSGNLITGGLLTATGNITGGNISTAGIFTASNTTANLQFANLITNNQQIQTVGARNVNIISSTVPDPGRITIGTGYFGNITPAIDIQNSGRSARLFVSDAYYQNDTAQRATGIQVTNYAIANANIANTNTRSVGITSILNVGGGSAGNTWGATAPLAVGGLSGAVVVGGGTSGALTAVGNTTVTNLFGTGAAILTNSGGNIRNAVTFYGTQNGAGSTGTIGNAIGVSTNFSGSSGTYTGNVYAFYNPGSASDFGFNNGNVARSATNYYFLRNDDNLAQNKMGSMRLFHEYRYDTATSGSITIDKNNGQCQQIALAGNVTISGFSNFVTTASDGTTTDYEFDTVTLVFKQGSTPYTITMPTGANYKYAANVTTFTSTANAVSMASVTAYDDGGTTKYLITLSPEFT